MSDKTTITMKPSEVVHDLELACYAIEEGDPELLARVRGALKRIVGAVSDDKAALSSREGEAVADTRWQPAGPEARRCRECNAPRKGDTCWKCGSETFKPHHSWVEAELPDVARIRALAKEVGYAIGEHGSKERDFDIIAAPWAENAVGFDELVAHIAAGINAHEVGDRERKPHGRVGVNLQIDGYYKLIDLSVMPLYAAPSARVAELEAKLEAKVADNLARSCADRLLRHGLRARIAALESQLAASREREGRMRELAMGARRAFAWFSERDGGEVALQLYKEYDEALAALAADKEQK